MSRVIDASEIREASTSMSQVNRVLEWTVLGTLVITLVIYLVTPFLAIGWFQQPFLGAFVEKTFILNGVGNPEDPAWDGREQLPPGSRLTHLAGVPVNSVRDLSGVLSEHQPGETVSAGVLTRSGEAQTGQVRLSRLPITDLFQYFIVPYFIGLVYLGIGLWVFRQRSSDAAGRAFALTCALGAIAVGALFDLYTTHLFTWAWTLAIPNIGAALIALALVFPTPVSAIRQRLAWRLVGFIPSFALAGYALYTLYFSPDPYAYVFAWLLCYFYMGFGLIAFVTMMLYRWRRDPVPQTQEQSRIIFWGSLASFSAVLIWVLQSLAMGRTAPFNSFTNLPWLILFPATVAFAILRYRLFNADAYISKGLVYAAILLTTLVGYGLILTGLTWLSVTVMRTDAPRADDPRAIALAVFLLVAGFNPLFNLLQRYIDQKFFRGSRLHAERVEQFGRSLTRATDLNEIIRALREPIAEVVRPSHLHLFLRDRTHNEFAACPDETGRPTTDLRFSGDGPLATYLAAERASLSLAPDQPLPGRLMRDRARLAVLGSALYIPMPGKHGLTGWLAVGPKQSGDPFNSNDLHFLESLADQAALAIERTAVISDLERRVKELNVITQMSQAVSFTVAYDDLLELMYAQASKIVDTRNFSVLLKDRRGAVRTAFVIQNNERLLTEENRAVPGERGLEGEVLRLGQPIWTADYAEECIRRNVAPGVSANPIRAWMGVPLNAGSDTIGVMMVMSSDPAVTYTEDQLKVFWTIADQAASAITKTRLFQQAEQRAKQLTTLNEVSLTIASTLELDPLLQRIVESAANILNCEAGSLFLIDQDSGAYVFRVATGPVGQNLIGMRIAPGKGLVGEAIESSRAIIVNDAHNDPRWFKGTDQSTGFVTHGLITVPLRFQGRPIGAIQLLNKRDGSPFDEEDQNLLTAFATPAAIAIENARLFTQTDQALAARVEELSVMQRVDRELNTTLELKQVLGILLDRAMQKSGANAGLVGIVNELGAQIFVSLGYDGVPDRQPGQLVMFDHGIIGRIAHTGEVSLSHDVPGDPDYAGALPGTQAQLVLPIKRERRVVGVISLESPSPDSFNVDNVDFVTRLVDHATIAITNAQLFAEVRAANLAKSDLMSFVAHELKTPMTPIKGWADILLSNAVGPLTDKQRELLGIVRNNIDRMKTIVNDMNDSASIEAGKMRLDPRATSLRHIVDDVTNTARTLVQNKHQTLVLEVEPDLPPVWADPTRTAQILTNLISNAHKYTPEGGQIVLRARRAANQWNPDSAPEVVHISVQDNGLGIAPEDQKKLFQKFFRAKDRLASDVPGTGLGLNIVKNLVEMQGGSIWFESEFRKGSTFHFTLPLALESASLDAGR
jgi:signal transduction histidine kinase/uncharacterized protein YigA (DUF484 family)